MPLLKACLALDPASADAWFCLADEAACRRVLSLDPGDAAALSNLGNLLRPDLAAAGRCFRAALARQPALTEGLNNLGNLLQESGDAARAGQVLEWAVALAPRRDEAWNALGNVRAHQGDAAAAVACYRQAVGFNPGNRKAHCHLADLLEQAGDFAGALAAYDAALAIDPHFGVALSGAAHLRRRLCDWRRIAEDETALKEAVRSGAGDISPFVFLTIDSTLEEQQRCARQWARRMCGGITPLPPAEPRRSGRLRVGYLSADFYEHPTAYLAAELFELHDRSRFEVFAYSWGPDDGSPMRRRLEAGFDHFIEIGDLSYEAAARRIRADGIDILVDVKGYTRHARTQILAWRPAPRQLQFLAYPGSMGASFIDAVIADPFVAPADHQPFYDERILALPDCYQVNDRRRRIAADRPDRAACGLPEEGPVLCAFNASYKLTPQMFDIWMRLLRAVPDAVLWLLAAGDMAEDNLRREAATRGVSPRRLVFAPKLPLDQHLARHALADLFLDTLPYNAHTTASDALWAGLPVLTAAGATFAGRVAGSLLQAVGMPELVVSSLEDYEAMASAVLTDPNKLNRFKKKLAGQRLTNRLFNCERFTLSLEASYIELVAGYDCATA